MESMLTSRQLWPRRSRPLQSARRRDGARGTKPGAKSLPANILDQLSPFRERRPSAACPDIFKPPARKVTRPILRQLIPASRLYLAHENNFVVITPEPTSSAARYAAPPHAKAGHAFRPSSTLPPFITIATASLHRWALTAPPRYTTNLSSSRRELVHQRCRETQLVLHSAKIIRHPATYSPFRVTAHTTFTPQQTVSSRKPNQCRPQATYPYTFAPALGNQLTLNPSSIGANQAKKAAPH